MTIEERLKKYGIEPLDNEQDLRFYQSQVRVGDKYRNTEEHEDLMHSMRFEVKTKKEV